MLTKEIMSNFATDRLSIALRVYSQKCLTLKYNGLRNRNKEQGMPKETILRESAPKNESSRTPCPHIY